MIEEGLNKYSIKDLENFTGIKAHTIRIWEKRYNILEPDRTDSNIRTYSENELKKILNVAYLNRNGLKISKIALLEEDELSQKVMSVNSQHDDPDEDFQPGKIIMSAMRFNEDKFIDSLNPFIKSHGFENCYINHLNPLMEKAGILWQTGCLSRAQEQFVRNTIKQIIITEHSLLKPVPEKNQTTVAMINPGDTSFENNFLFYRYALKKRRFDVIFTGGILHSSEVTEIHKTKQFDYLVVNSGSFDFSEKKISYFNSIGKSLMIKKIILTDSSKKNNKKTFEKLLFVSDPAHFVKSIETLK
jgi:MerR family transcriptional regulator, light-induced transcriptional regulator